MAIHSLHPCNYPSIPVPPPSLPFPSIFSYEPELFPGLIYRMVKPRVVLLVFVSGKVVLTGAKERSQIIEAFENIYPILRHFKKS